MFCKHGPCHVEHIWKQFVSEAELVCPRSCFLLKCLHAHCPPFLPLAFPPPLPTRTTTASPRKEEAQILGRSTERAVVGGDGPTGGTLFPQLGMWGTGGQTRPLRWRASSVSKLSRESKRTCVFSAVRSKNRVLWSPAQTCHWQSQAKGGGEVTGDARGVPRMERKVDRSGQKGREPSAPAGEGRLLSHRGSTRIAHGPRQGL